MTVYILPAPGVIDLDGHFVPMADERYHFCGQVRYQAKIGQPPAVFCNATNQPPLTCPLAGDQTPCAFVESAFDWQKARRLAQDQPLHPPDFESLEGWQARILRTTAERTTHD